MTDELADPRADLRWPTIPAVLDDAVAERGDAEAIVDAGVRWSWRDVGTAVDRATAAFVAAGVERGDRVAIWAPNCAEWIVALLGLQSAGAALVPLNTRYMGVEAADILDRSRARVLVTVDGFLGNDYLSMLAGHDLPHLERIVVLRSDSTADPRAETWEAFLASGDGVGIEAVRARRAAVQPSDTSDLLFTSGTTGKPKGVICTHAQTLRTVGAWAAVNGLADTDRYVCVNPFFHSFGYKAGIVAWLETRCVLLPVGVFDVPEVMRLIAAERGSMLPGAPTLYQTILNHPDRDQLDSSSLRLAVTGAAAIPVSLVQQMRDDLGFDTVVTAYGLTEACGFVSICRPDDDDETIATTSGRAMPGIEVRLVDGDGAEVPTGEPGEILVRGYNVMAGYFEDPEATAATIDADGWLHTGDVGVMDERGYLDITDRIKDLFIVGGFNAYPAEIEDLLLGHPDIAQVAVVGVPDERQGEVGAAFVVPVNGRSPQPDEIIAWAREHMANFKAPRHVSVVDSLPVNPSGKVVKFELRALFEENP
jgi:acyl-CoA synthetase (AMP-forming)/AMP-acid ligase II